MRMDRDTEFVHLKDHRGRGADPVNVLSGCRWQDNPGCYETMRGTAGTRVACGWRRNSALADFGQIKSVFSFGIELCHLFIETPVSKPIGV